MTPATGRPTANTIALLQQALAHIGRNEMAQADAVLTKAMTTAPNNPDALQLMGVVRRAQGRLGEAEACYRQSISLSPAFPNVRHNLGNLLRSQGRYDEAIVELREAIRLKQDYLDAHLTLALALSDRGDHELAIKSCRNALRLQPNSLHAKHMLAAELNEVDRPQEAEVILRRTLAEGVRDTRQYAELEHNLGISFKQQGRYDEALLLFNAAQAKFPAMAAVDYNRGNTLREIGKFKDAFNSYLQAIARRPDDVDSLAYAGLTAMELGDYVTARAYAERALAIRPDHGIALVALAVSELEAGDTGAAEKHIQVLRDPTRFAANRDVSLALGFVADAYDRRADVAAAFSLQTLSNDRRRAIGAAVYDDCRTVDEVGRLLNYFENSGAWPASPDLPPADFAAAGHVFVLGFMRSGTTLLATILAGHPDVVIIDEQEFLTEPSREFLLTGDGMSRLATLGGADISRWQTDYWKAVRDAGFAVSGKVFVDKMPFNTIRLPLIARLFPSAKILFAVRDPRDVVLSCFRRRFNMGPYSFEFLRLDDCARFYSAVMLLSERYREKLPLQILEHRYEDAVADFDTTTRAACDFIGIEWRESMRDFSAAAKEIDHRSASALQVRRGLYGDAAGQWRRYRKYLEPVMPILQPWIERFGYPAD